MKQGGRGMKGIKLREGWREGEERKKDTKEEGSEGRSG